MRSLIELYAGKTVLGIGAHPDDLEIGVGGTLARLSEAGASVVMVIVSVPGLLEERLRETERAAAILGARSVVLERERCLRVEDLPMHELVGRLDAVVRDMHPAAIFTHSSEEVHHDHFLVHRAVLCTMRLGPMDVYLFGPSTCKPTLRGWQPRVWVDVGRTIDLKVRAIAAHDSQFGRRGICVERFRQQAQTQGLPIGASYAEGLDVVCVRA